MSNYENDSEYSEEATIALAKQAIEKEYLVTLKANKTTFAGGTEEEMIPTDDFEKICEIIFRNPGCKLAVMKRTALIHIGTSTFQEIHDDLNNLAKIFMPYIHIFSKDNTKSALQIFSTFIRVVNLCLARPSLPDNEVKKIALDVFNNGSFK